MEPCFCHQAPACRAPSTVLSGNRKIYERKLGKQVDGTQLGWRDDQSRLHAMGFPCPLSCSALTDQACRGGSGGGLGSPWLSGFRLTP